MSIKVLIGDVFTQLATLPDESVDCVVTSPPYWGLRDYGVKGQIGLEKTLGEHLEIMVKVFEEVRRVLKKKGTCWVNYGDCYATQPNGRSAVDTKKAGKDDRTFRDKPFSTVQGKMKNKDLCMVPNRLAIALQDAGWWVRSEIIWAKDNPMPESVKDRPATSHEKIFLLTKSVKYFYNADAVRTPLQPKTATTWGTKRPMIDTPGDLIKAANFARSMPDRKPRQLPIPAGWNQGEGAHGNFHPEGSRRSEKQRGHSRRHAGFNDRWDQMTREEQQASGANLKNVWRISTRGFTGAHFATFPTELPEICIKAGCPEKGIVLDPFGGSGTTAMVADRLGRDAILIELNPEYVSMALSRIENDAPMLVKIETPTANQRGDARADKPKPPKRKVHDRSSKPKSRSTRHKDGRAGGSTTPGPRPANRKSGKNRLG